MEQEENKKMFTIKVVLLSILIIFFVGISLLTFVFYSYSSGNKEGFSGFIMNKFDYPVVIVDYSNPIYFSEMKENVSALEKFYENQDFSKIGMRIDFSTDDGKKRLKIKEKEVINKLVEDKFIEILSKEKGISIETADVDKGVEEAIGEYGNSIAEIEADLEKLYGWGMQDFKEKIVMPSMYKEALEKTVSEEINSDKSSFEKISKAKREIDSRKDFSVVAKEYSEGSGAENGGEIGWVRKDQLDEDVAKSIFSENGGSGNEIIESSLGYHIVKIEESKKEDSVDLVRIKQIFIRKNNFADWLGEKMKSMKVQILMKDYYWNADDSIVDFKDEIMRADEKSLREKSEGDASMIF